jgi:hypothetical protein
MVGELDGLTGALMADLELAKELTLAAWGKIGEVPAFTEKIAEESGNDPAKAISGMFDTIYKAVRETYESF